MANPILLAVSHGTSSVAGQRAIAALVDAVAERLPEVDVRLAHVDVQQPDVVTALADVPIGRDVVLVPLLLAAGYHVHVDLAEAAATRPGTVITPALGPDARLATVLAARLGTPDAATSGPIILAAAGSSDDRANVASAQTAELLHAATGDSVTVAYLAAAEPTLSAAVADAREQDPRTRVATYLLAPGYFHDLATKLADGLPVTRPLLDDDAPHPSLVELVIDRYRVR